MPTNTPAPDRHAGVTVVYAVLREDGSLTYITDERYAAERYMKIVADPAWNLTTHELHPLGTASKLEKAREALEDVQFRFFGAGPSHSSPIEQQIAAALTSLTEKETTDV